ncbi:MAG: hypothetical protein PUB01_03285 [Desulfovibrionaceae bacterium]|nr:hypothetical protein [Desulfovibrionaceae bacterium]
MNNYLIVALIVGEIFFVGGCKPPTTPKLPEMQAQTPVKTSYTKSLSDLNTVLEVYLPPDFKNVFYYVKPIRDVTGLAATGEIPLSITTLVRDAVSQVYHKVRYVEQYDETDQIHQQVLTLMQQTNKIVDSTLAVRPKADFTISGAISQFDRNLESSSQNAKAMANIGEGLSRTDASASAESSSRLSRLGISLNVTNTNGVSVPGKYGATMELTFEKNGVDFGFSIFGNGIGYAAESTAMHGRHLALQMMCELSVVQVIGRTLNVPYWRVGGTGNIFKEDPLVVQAWHQEYSDMSAQGLLIPYMQAQCIANGVPVSVTGQLDSTTQAALQELAQRYAVKNNVFPNFEMYKALELNRRLDTSLSSSAWAAYAGYKGKGASSAPAMSPAQTPAKPKEARRTHTPTPSTKQPSPSPRIEDPLGKIL